MTEYGLDALIATSTENVIYCADYTSWTVDAFKDLEVYVVVPQDGELALVVPIDAADYLAGRPASVEDIHTYGTYHIMQKQGVVLSGAEARLLALREQSSHHPSAIAALQHILADRGISGGTVGLDERGVSPAQWRALTEAFGATDVQEANDLFRIIRSIKTEEEIERLRYAVRAVETGMGAAFIAATAGRTEAELERVFRSTVAATGVTPGHFETSAGTRSAASFPASPDYQIQSGDIIRSDCGGRYLGYWADTGRTMVVGNPPTRLARYYEALLAGIDAIIGMIRPGVPISALFTAGVETVREAGIPHYQRHHVGHAIGLEMYEAPILTEVARNGTHRFGAIATVLEPSMVINIELPYYELGLGGLQIEETLVVREAGYEVLTTASRDLLRYIAAG